MRHFVVTAFALAATLACGSGSSTPTAATNTGTGTNTTGTTTKTGGSSTTTLPAGYEKFTGSATVQLSGSTVIINSTDIPNHKSPYFGVGNANYVAPTAGIALNPSHIAAQSYVFHIPATPTAAASPSDTPLDAIGISLNGVVFFNQYAAGRVPLTTEIVSFDQFNGHPAMQNNYHYHFEPLFLTAGSKSALIGFILDGYPIYGPQETSGAAPTSLDACNGHTHATVEYPNGIYHYHVVSSPPYLVGCFHGTPGTVSN
jgi:hypothetical protein